MPTSTAPAAQAELVELLQADDDLDGVHITFYTGSAKLPKADDYIFVLHSRNYSRSRGEQYMVEAYDLAVEVVIYRPGEDTAADADTRRWELIDKVDAVLRKNDYHGYSTRGGDVETSGEGLDPYDQGWIASSVATFSIETIQQG